MKLLITGGAGFIGSAVVRKAIADGHDVINVDALTYAACSKNVASIADHPRYYFEKADICDADAMTRVLDTHHPDAVLHLAAESHVDRSIDGPAAFVRTNVTGTCTLLGAALRYWRRRDKVAGFRFHHVSTDEVFGSLDATGLFNEDTVYAPRNPYAASKAASDHFVRAWGETYGLPIVVTNCSNNYGPYQFPEKLIPVTLINALESAPLPVYGNGVHVRDWLYVEDHADALLTVLSKGKLGRTYNIGGNNDCSNLTLVQTLCEMLDQKKPRADGASYRDQITFVEDRPGHDARYAIDASRLRYELGWTPSVTLDEGLSRTIDWYLENETWWRAIMKREGVGQRLGTG